MVGLRCLGGLVVVVGGCGGFDYLFLFMWGLIMGKKLKLWAGNFPDDQMWSKYMDIGNIYGVNWVLFIKVQDYDSPWQNFKLVADGIVKGKANYRFSWNGERFAGNGPMESLQEWRPELYRVVVDLMEKVAA